MLSAVDLYHRLPPSLRGIVATGRGHYLRRWRYGPETNALVAQALERDGWDETRWAEWRSRRLAQVLERAVRRVPHYRDLWSAQPAGQSGVAPLAQWPVLSKETLRSAPSRFLADDCRAGDMFHEHTSGTTGKSLDLWWSRPTVRAWYALFEARVRNWNGVGRGDRWAMLGGQLVAPVDQRRPPYWVWNGGLHQLYLSSYHLSAATVRGYLDAMAAYGVRYVFGYASSLDSLARFALEGGHAAPRMEVAISNAEPLLQHQRERVGKVFGCPVRDTYGMAEIAAAGSECAEGRMHQWPDVGVIEILRDDRDEPADPGHAGRIVATGLLNADMPLIRYDTGDRGTSGVATGPCGCGRRLPVLESIEGRSDDVVLTEDGRRIGRLDPIFKARRGVREAQIIQETLSRFRILIVPGEDFRDADADEIGEGLRQRVGSRVEIEFQRVDRIPRTAAGKFRAVVSHVDRRVGPGAPG